MTRQNFSSKGASTMGNVAQTGTTSKRVLLIYRFWSFIFSLHLNTILANCCFVFLTIFVGIGRGRGGVAQKPGGLDGALDPAGRLPARHDQRGRLRPGRWVWTLKLVPILTFPPHSVRPAAWRHDRREAGAARHPQGEDQGLQVWFGFHLLGSSVSIDTDNRWDCLENNKKLCRECLSEEEVQSTKMNQNRRH